MSSLIVAATGTGLLRLTVPAFMIITVMAAGLSYAQPVPVPEGARCDECGMSLDRDSKFLSEAITRDNKNLFFCDVGDMLFHFRSKRDLLKIAYVRDYVTGGWIDAGKALYVPNKKFKTPMSWGIAAFAERSDAAPWGTPVDFDSAFGLAK